MRANDFIRRFGIGEAKRLLKDSRGCSSVSLYSGEYKFDTDDLKRLVESHELVEKLDGIDECINIISNEENIMIINNLRRASNQSMINVDRLKQAIADVESCQ